VLSLFNLVPWCFSHLGTMWVINKGNTYIFPKFYFRYES
jgi:hypothetical protein